jgi:hypothetical protein
MNAYAKSIIAATGCTPEDAVHIEDILRGKFGTLGSMSAQRLTSEAKKAVKSLVQLRAMGFYQS